MAGEHVKDAKQATGVRATVRTLRTYTNVKLCFFFFKQKRTLWKKKCYGYCNSAVTIITNTQRYYLATHNTTEMTLKR